MKVLAKSAKTRFFPPILTQLALGRRSKEVPVRCLADGLVASPPLLDHRCFRARGSVEKLQHRKQNSWAPGCLRLWLVGLLGRLARTDLTSDSPLAFEPRARVASSRPGRTIVPSPAAPSPSSPTRAADLSVAPAWAGNQALSSWASEGPTSPAAAANGAASGSVLPPWPPPPRRSVSRPPVGPSRHYP